MPSISYRVVNGIAIPRDLYTLGSFQGLQRAINTWRSSGYATTSIYHAPGGLIGVDGEIGNGTFNAARELIAYLNEGGESIPPPSSVASLAERCRTYAAEILRPQDKTPNFSPAPSTQQRDLPGTVSTGPAPPASPSTPGGKWPWVVGGLLLAGVVAYTKLGRHDDPRGDT